MCGRFFLWLEDGTREIIFPTDDITVLTREGWKTLHWGICGIDGRPLINARCETISVKPTFRASFRQRRCLVPADGFFEWMRREGKRTKDCYQVTDAASDRMMMAGIYTEQDECVIITQPADAVVGAIHDRMPVFIQSPEMQELWLHQDALAEIVLAANRKNTLQMKPETQDVSPKRRAQQEADEQMVLDID